MAAQTVPTGDEEEAAGATYGRYLPVTVGGCSTAALVDSGNLWRTAVSWRFAQRMGLTEADLRPLPVASIATAKEGARLEVMGETRRKLQLRLGGLTQHLCIRPVVVRGLAMDMNLSGPLLKLHRIDQLHSRGCLRFQGQDLPLLTAGDLRADRRPVCGSPVYVAQATTIAPMTWAPVQLRAPAVEKRTMPAGDAILQGCAEFMSRTDTHPWMGALVRCDADGALIGGVFNSRPETIRIKEGLRYGDITLVEDPDPALLAGEDQLAGMAPATLASGNLRRQKGLTPPEGLPEATGTEARPQTEDEKKQWIQKQFKLQESPCLKTEEDVRRATALLLKYWDVFSRDGDCGKTDLLEHAIVVDKDKTPIRCKRRPVNPALEQSLKDQLELWKKQGVIEPTNSAWSFPLLAVPKKNGKVRWVTDFRLLNEISRRDAYPVPSIEDNLAKLSGSACFSAVDGCAAFHAISIREQDRDYTAFATPWGAWRYARMPFGLCNAPATYCRLVDMVLAGINTSDALPYLDDTCVHSKDLEGHFGALEKVLEAHLKAGLRLQADKCQLFRDSIEYLGHEISARGVRPMPAYTEVVAKWPLPTTRTQVRTFLGKTGYYRRFVPSYSAIAAPLTSIVGQTDAATERAPLTLTPEMRHAFEELQRQLLQAPILAYPRFDSSEPFILDTDWSQAANTMGAVLSQRQDGEERAICYGAKKLSTAQANYPSNKGELAAVIYFMRLWRYYLQFRRFVLRTDAVALKWIRTMEAPAGMISRWLDTLANFDFEVQHRAATKHGNADALSRVDHAEAAEPDDPAAEQMYALERKQPWTRTELLELQLADEDLRQVHKWLTRRRAPDSLEARALSVDGQIYAGQFDSLELDDDGLANLRRYDSRAPSGARQLKVCLPRETWDEAMRVVHETGSHMAVLATMTRLQRNAYFPHMKREVTDFIASCRRCQESGRAPKAQRHTLVSQHEGYPFQRISCDYVGPIRESKQGSCYLLTVKDTFSRWLEAFPVATATAMGTVKLLEKEIFARYAIPDTIHTDCGTQFTSRLFREVGRVLGIRVTTTPPYNPKSNPVERAHRDLGAALRAVVGPDMADWESALPQVLFAMRTAVCSSTGLAPYQILFGRDASQPIDLVFGGPPTEGPEAPGDHHRYAAKLTERIQRAHTYARQHLGTAVRRQRRQYHLDRRTFEAGALVWLFTPVTKAGESKKLTSCYSGPWQIVEKINELTFRLRPSPGWSDEKGERVCSIDRLKPYRPPRDADGLEPPSAPPEDGDDLSLAGDEFAEMLQLPRGHQDPGPSGPRLWPHHDDPGGGDDPPPDLGPDLDPDPEPDPGPDPEPEPRPPDARPPPPPPPGEPPRRRLRPRGALRRPARFRDAASGSEYDASHSSGSARRRLARDRDPDWAPRAEDDSDSDSGGAVAVVPPGSPV